MLKGLYGINLHSISLKEDGMLINFCDIPIVLRAGRVWILNVPVTHILVRARL